MAENKFYDYATGKEVKSNPEETYRQLFEHILIDDLGYPKSHIDIEVVLQRGAKRNAEEVDIVVYNSDVHKQENAYIIIEIETPKKKYDLQAFSYVTATTAPYCVWFAGFDKNSEGPFYHYRDLKKDPTKNISDCIINTNLDQSSPYIISFSLKNAPAMSFNL